MSSPDVRRRRSISYTPDEEDEEVLAPADQSVAPQDDEQEEEDGVDVEEGSQDEEDEIADDNETHLGDTTAGDMTRASSEEKEEGQADEESDDDDDDDEGEGEGDNDADPDNDVDASTTRGASVSVSAQEDVKPSVWPPSSSSSSAKIIADILNYKEAPIPDDVNPGSANLYSTAAGEKLMRNTPIKKHDGTTFHRSDLQHAMLMELFNDTTRCFRNPRPAPEGSWTSAPKPGEAAATGVPEYTPVYPYGQSRGTARRSNETEEEYKEWEKRWEAYHKNPYPTKEEDPEGKVPRPGAKLLTFKELYMEALMNSPRCTKAVRDKIWADEQFAEDFACVNLLINVGRMNTTLAFFAQMQTVLRSYHPLPCLQGCDNSRKHMQDAPRMKSLLKSVLLPFEKASTGPGSAPISKTAQAANAEHAVPAHEMLEIPATLDEVLKRFSEGYVPATSVVNLVFIFATQANDLSAMHFTHPHDAHSIFFPHKDYPIPARDRAKVFLWLVWHYLEGAALLPPGNEMVQDNPFGDDRTLKSAIRAKAKWESLDDKSRKKATVGGKGTMWLGVRNKKERSSGNKKADDSAEAADGEKPTSAESSRAGASTTTLDAAPADAGAASDDPDSSWEVEDNERYTHRQLAPFMSVISQEAIRKENIDLPDENSWGNEQAAERREFMARMAEEERQKGMEGELASGKGKGKGKGKGTATKGKGKKGKGYTTPIPGTEGKKRRGGGPGSRGGRGGGAGRGRGGKRKALDTRADDSSVAAAAAAVLASKGGLGKASAGTHLDGPDSKRRRLSAHAAAVKAREALQELGVDIDDPSTAEELGATNGLLPTASEHETLLANVLQQAHSQQQQQRGDISRGPGPRKLAANRGLPPKRPLTRDDLQPGLEFEGESGELESLPALAWNRILQRALRGQGDACYESDDEDEAMDEAQRCGEMFRGELSRALNAIWNSSPSMNSLVGQQALQVDSATKSKPRSASSATIATTVQDPFARRTREINAALAK